MNLGVQPLLENAHDNCFLAGDCAVPAHVYSESFVCVPLNDPLKMVHRSSISVGYETYVNDPVTLKQKDYMLYEYIRDYMRG